MILAGNVEGQKKITYGKVTVKLGCKTMDSDSVANCKGTSADGIMRDIIPEDMT